jgi:hypothetical protein
VLCPPCATTAAEPAFADPLLAPALETATPAVPPLCVLLPPVDAAPPFEAELLIGLEQPAKPKKKQASEASGTERGTRMCLQWRGD